LMLVSLVSPKGTRDDKFLANYANLYVKDAIMRVKGVGDVTAFGQPFSMRVWLDANKLTTLNLTPADVSTAISEQNLRMPGGSVGAPPLQNPQVFEYPVITDSDLSSVEDFEEIIVKANEDGSIVQLKDVARVELGQFSYATNTRTDGMISTGMMVAQTPGGSVGAPPLQNPQVFEYPVITDSDLSSVEDFEEIIVKANEDGSIVQLKDVARVELGQFSYATNTRTDGMISTGMMVAQTPGGN